MIPIYKARGLADGRHQELLADAERHRLVAALPAGPGALQRLALRAAGWGRRPAVAPRPAALLPRAYRPSAI
jgi:hypothetical protein